MALGWYGSVRDAPPPRQPSIVSPSAEPTAAKPEATATTPQPFYTAPSSRTQSEERLFTTRKVKMRVDASVDAGELAILPAGAQVVALGRRGDWHSVRFGGHTGWISSRYLSPDMPRRAVSPVPAVPRQMTRSSSQPVRSGQPLRKPMVGRCDCPYDLMRNGRLCGGRSAYSRPGGRSPICYF